MHCGVTINQILHVLMETYSPFIPLDDRLIINFQLLDRVEVNFSLFMASKALKSEQQSQLQRCFLFGELLQSCEAKKEGRREKEKKKNKGPSDVKAPGCCQTQRTKGDILYTQRNNTQLMHYSPLQTQEACKYPGKANQWEGSVTVRNNAWKEWASTVSVCFLKTGIQPFLKNILLYWVNTCYQTATCRMYLISLFGD